MAESTPSSFGRALEAALASLGREVAYPDLPDVSPAVVGRLATGARLRALPFGGAARTLRPLVHPVWTRVAAVAAVIALLMSGVLTFSPTARRAVADFLGLRGERIHIGRTIPSAPLRPLGEGLDLGKRSTLSEARATAGYRILVPSDPALGPPDEVYVQASDLGVQVSLVYRARPGLPSAPQTGVGLLVTEFRARLNQEFIYKAVGAGGTVEPATVDGHLGFWISGQPHELFYVGPGGAPIPDTIRLAANVLVWEQAGVTIRFESPLTEAEALRIARSVR